MTNYLLRGELGFNTFYIKNHFDGELNILTKEDELPTFTKDDHIVRWGTRRKIPNGPKIVNKGTAIAQTSEKGLFRKKVADIGWAPKTWLSLIDFCFDIVADVSQPSNGVVIRPLSHERSENLYFCTSGEQIKEACQKLGEGNYYISEFIPKEAEYRVFIASGRPFIMAEKNPPDKNAVSWGCVDGGGFEYIAWDDWIPSVAQCAVESFNLSALDFAAIDIIYKDGQAYFLEANTAPEILNYYGKSFAKVFKYMFEHGRERILVSNYDNWKSYIHPAMSEKAIVNG